MKIKQIGLTFAEEEFIQPGHPTCHGCGEILCVRHVLKLIGSRSILITVTGCISTEFGRRTTVPSTRIAMGSGGAVATGVRAALDMSGDRKTHVVVCSGDGGTFDIGLQAMSGAAERNENIIWICCDNEGFMKTGYQASSATPSGTRTTTTGSKSYRKKDIMTIVSGHGIGYAASASIAYPMDLHRKTQRIINEKGGFRFLYLNAPCPPGWGYPPELTMEMARRAVNSHAFPLFEIENSIKYSIQLPRVSETIHRYYAPQQRFAQLSASEIDEIQKQVEDRQAQLISRAASIEYIDPY